MITGLNSMNNFNNINLDYLNAIFASLHPATFSITACSSQGATMQNIRSLDLVSSNLGLRRVKLVHMHSTFPPL